MYDFVSGPNPDPLDAAQLESLRQLVARLKAHQGPWGESAGGDELAPGAYTWNYVEKGELARTAMDWFYDCKRILMFDWGSWDEGRDIFEMWSDTTAASLDHLTVRKLITAIARNDRFSEGTWVDMFEDGFGVPLFARLLELEEELAASR